MPGACPACGQPENHCRCEHWCDLCGIWTTHTTTYHADVLVRDALGEEDDGE